MQRAILTAAAFFALVPAAHAAARPQAALVSCDRVHRSASFEGRMDTRPATARMQMRFILQDREDGRWSRVTVPGFSAWQTSATGRARYVYTKTVQALVGPASYRVAVRFRWLDAHGDVLRRARAFSPSCRQPDPRADLWVAALDVRPSLLPGRRRYAVTVLNSGRSTAPASRVSVDVGDGSAPRTGAVGSLAPGERAIVLIGGPACVPGALVTATADASDVVDEHDEDDDVLSAACPASS
jgi:hypothetical protein